MQLMLLVSFFWCFPEAQGEPESIDFGVQLKALAQKIQDAEADSRGLLVEGYLKALESWLKSADAKERDPANAQRHLLEYAEVLDAAAALARTGLGSGQEALTRLTAEAQERVRRWSEPDRYWQENMGRAKALWSEKRFGDAAELIRKAGEVGTAAQKADTAFLIAIVTLAEGRVVAGKALLEDHLARWPDSKRRHAIRYLLAHIHWLTLDYGKAAEAFEAVARESPDSRYGKGAAKYHEALKRASEQFFFTYE
jgi:TolA-binding protein